MQEKARPAWRKVLVLGEQLLSSKTKDFEVAVWFLEALLRERQFSVL